MAKVVDITDLLEYKLAVILATEKTTERMLPKLAKEANNKELARGFEQHAQETKDHVARVEQAFSLLGRGKPRSAKAPAAEGLELEHKAFAAEADESVLPDVLDLVAVGSAAATEHHEIAAYEAVISLAQTAGAQELVQLLNQNLTQERNMLEQTRAIGERLGAAALGELGAERISAADAAAALSADEIRTTP